jgi:hypothetical protein
MRFVVTGTGRSGTGYAARLFSNAGLPCGHEEVFGPLPGLRDPEVRPLPRRPTLRARVHLSRVAVEYRQRRTELLGDASWMAVPRLGRFRGAVFLQLRDPLKVVSSFQGTRFFMPERHRQRQTRYALKYFEPVGDPVLDAMRWWVQWNERAEQWATLTYRLEDISPELVDRMIELAGLAPVCPVEEAIAKTASDVNSAASRGHPTAPLRWDDLPAGPELDALARASERYGYATG